MIDCLRCLFVSPSLCLFRFGQLLRHTDKCIVNIMKAYIVYICEAMDSMGYRPQNANQGVPNKKHFGSVPVSLDRLYGRH